MQIRWSSIIITAVLVVCSVPLAGSAQTEKVPTAFERLYNAGQAAMAQGRYAEALGDFEQLQKMDSTVAEVHATLGVLYFKSGDFDHAVAEIHIARKLKPSLPGLDALLALSLAESGRYKDSLPGLEKAFHASSNPALKRQAGLELAHVYSMLSMDRKAVEVALEMRDLYKDDPEVLYNVGKILGNSAYLTMVDLFHSGRDSMWAQLAEAEAYESQGQVADAIESYHRVLAINPNQVNIHYRMGRTYLSHWKLAHEQIDLQNAKTEFAKELELNPGNANAAYELAEVNRAAGNLASAEQLYESAVTAYPNFEEAEVGLGRVLSEENKPAQALPHLLRAASLRPDDEVAWYRLAEVQRKLGDTQAQKQSLTRFEALHVKTTAALNAALPSQSSQSVTPQQLDPADQKQ